MLNSNLGIPRSFEAVIALTVLVLSAPLLLLVYAAVALTSKGPAIFQQERVGLRGRIFKLYKFRTMYIGSSGPQVTAGDDSRVTSVGKILRKTKLDELPELWNVVTGEMSFVGPRPEVPKYVDLSNPLWQEVLRVRPGITDPVTLRLRNEEALLTSVDGDREHFYLQELQPFKLQGYKQYSIKRNFASDLGVLWKTAIAVLLPDTATPPTRSEISNCRHEDRLIM
jgi:lipopolysaccharide/colanic/teichoic acid biosynthesis glycosyltransferase